MLGGIDFGVKLGMKHYRTQRLSLLTNQVGNGIRREGEVYTIRTITYTHTQYKHAQKLFGPPKGSGFTVTTFPIITFCHVE